MLSTKFKRNEMRAKALYANTADSADELSFKPGDILTVIEQNVAGLDGWWLCTIGQHTGIAPGNRLRLLPDTDKHPAIKPITSSRPEVVTSQDVGRTRTASNASQLKIPHKSGKVYVYDSPTKPDSDYAVPSPQHNAIDTSHDQPDYDVPQSSTSDYDVPAPQSNRSSMVSVRSTGSQSSATSCRERHLAAVPTGATNGYLQSIRDSVLDDYDVPRCDVTSDESTSADSGVYCSEQGPKLADTRQVTFTETASNEADEIPDYDIPDAYYAHDSSSTTPTMEMSHRNNENNANNGDHVMVLRLGDNVLKNVDRMAQWLDDEQSANWSVRVKLAGLALKTSLHELITLDSHQQQQQQHPRCQSEQALISSFLQLNQCLNCFVASSSSRHPSPSNRTLQHAPMTSHCSLETRDAIRQLTIVLPVQIKRFADDVITGNTQQRSLEVNIPSPCHDASSNSPATTLTSPKSPASSPRSGKPPPDVKPKPNKQTVEAARQQQQQQQRAGNHVTISGDDGWSDECDYAAIATEAERELRCDMTSPHQQHPPPATAASTSTTASLPPRPPPSTSSKPPIGKKPLGAQCRAAAVAARHPQLSGADRELIEFYAAQITDHTSVVESAARDFFQCTSAPNASSLPAEVFLRRSRFVVLAGHKLVYLSDSLARHVTDETVRDRVAMAANELCEQLKTVVVATKRTALARTVDASDCERSMVESVNRATQSCRRLTSIINDISHW